MDWLDTEKERLMRRCYELAVSAGKKGYDTFGALLAHEGKILGGGRKYGRL